MARRRLFDYDPLTGITTFWHDTEPGGEAVLEEVQDVQGIVEHNKAKMAQIDERARFGDGLTDQTHVAHIPEVIVNDLWRRGIWQEPARLRAWLNDADNRAFRTRPGRV